MRTAWPVAADRATEMRTSCPPPSPVRPSISIGFSDLLRIMQVAFNTAPLASVSLKMRQSDYAVRQEFATQLGFA